MASFDMETGRGRVPAKWNKSPAASPRYDSDGVLHMVEGEEVRVYRVTR
jgi:hypothetical protein